MNTFFQSKKVLVTGHTGFKGAWLCRTLQLLGADVVGYALEAQEPSLFRLASMDTSMDSRIGDIRDLDALSAVFRQVRPEIVFHLAAQPIVATGYEQPVDTFSTNILGTVHLLECIRQSESVRSAIIVTTDKVYTPKDGPLLEEDALGGLDPYSASKSSAEFVAQSYYASYLAAKSIPVSTMRSGNVLGGGDFANNRLLPDAIRAIQNHTSLPLRNPNHVRSYQFVLHAIWAYLEMARLQTVTPSLAGSYNVGPNPPEAWSSLSIVTRFAELLKEQTPFRLDCHISAESSFTETPAVLLDTHKLHEVLPHLPSYSIEETLAHLVRWTTCLIEGEDVTSFMDQTIQSFLT